MYITAVAAIFTAASITLSRMFFGYRKEKWVMLLAELALAIWR